jgi:glycerophosphoryl diester phosphodiesterase
VAHELGLEGVEFDVQRSADGELVVFHDESLDRTSTGSGPLGAKTWAELQSLDAGAWFGARYAGERIPSLRAAFDFLRTTDLLLFVELKSPSLYPGMEEGVADLIREYGLIERCQVRSFEHDSLRRFHDYAPEIPLSELWWEKLPGEDETFTRTLDCLHHLLSAEAVGEIHSRGQTVTAWTVNEAAVARQLIAWGVDSLTTDYPDQMLSF